MVLIETIKKLFLLLRNRERPQFYTLMFLTISSAVIDVAGVGTILPFIALILDEAALNNNPVLPLLFEYGQFTDLRAFQVFFGICLLVIFVLSMGFRALMTRSQLRFVVYQEHSLTSKLVRLYLSQKYEWFLKKSSSTLGHKILSEVEHICIHGLLPMVQFISNLVLLILILLLLLTVNMSITIYSIVIIGGSYFLIFYLVKGKLVQIGEARANANGRRFKYVTEAFGGVKTIKALGLEHNYQALFSNTASKYAQKHFMAQIIAKLPRYFLEAIVFGGMIVLILILLNSGKPINTIIPELALFAFAGYRIMPAAQQLYNTSTNLQFINPSVTDLYSQINAIKEEQLIDFNHKRKIIIKDNLELKNIFYKYPSNKNYTLKNINLKIHANTVVGFVGASGCGKTTLADIIMGLLVPQAGSLILDGSPRDFGKNNTMSGGIGYVPQDVFLLDASIEENITLSENCEKVDFEFLEEVTKIAGIHDFITKKLKNQYKTVVGERGSRLSGGQRQRIGIARALYQRPSLLILDEGTSALDGGTEKDVMNSIFKMKRKTTVILIAHRLNTLEKCQNIFLFKDGMLLESGNFEELRINSSEFRDIAGIS